ncbi:hypothetical protein Acsp03_36580 [Actinomadura sp. NBRC 104412]|uniref:hypothetical protein n=1 Tax=Actinomadura sp. NBRC 104412 TaxID=3032203 RepID=UPI0024A10F29|nr:hypothetical protein [Actinomadura sp. NBRC 104412]GLZ06192.1 hypothetical protein Acsp03_36580 [Actinomadura sp. NBRC 104412]
MPGIAPDELDIHFTTTKDVGEEDVRLAREAVAWALAHVARPVLYAKATLSVLKDPAVPYPNLVSLRVDLNGVPINAHAAAASMPQAIAQSGRRLRARVEHMATYWEAQRKKARTTKRGTTSRRDVR